MKHSAIDMAAMCQDPVTMTDLINMGVERHTVYNAVKKGWIINLNARDAWGRATHRPGLFVSTVRPGKYDAAPLVSAWERTAP